MTTKKRVLLIVLPVILVMGLVLALPQIRGLFTGGITTYELMLHPEKYEGRQVKIKGYVSLTVTKNRDASLHTGLAVVGDPQMIARPANTEGDNIMTTDTVFVMLTGSGLLRG